MYFLGERRKNHEKLVARCFLASDKRDTFSPWSALRSELSYYEALVEISQRLQEIDLCFCAYIPH